MAMSLLKNGSFVIKRKQLAAVYGLLNGRTFSREQSTLTATELYTDDHKEIQYSLNKFIEKEINPYVDEWEKAEFFPAHELFKKLGNNGFLGVNKPSKYGGLGLDFSYSMAVAEELGTINCGSIPMAIGVQTDMSTPALAKFGSEELKQEFLVPTIAGDYVACLGVSEVGAGSDVANIQTKAVKDGDDLIINGQKMWITNGCQADWMCLLANTSDGPPHKSKSLICMPMKLPGVHVARKISKIGMKSSDTGQIFLENVRVPKRYIIGEEGKGFLYQMLQFQEERMWGAVGVVRPLEKIIQQTIDYTSNRKIFEKSILDHQVVHFKLAELHTELELFKAFLHKCVSLYIAGNDVTKFASMSKLKAGRLAREISDSCLQYWGGMGFTDEVFVSRCFRDFRLLSIGAGADEVMLSIICKYMDILPKTKK
ncbi:probable acyl-CoA dehydrogenase 6 [Argonauta hians]